MRTLVIEAAGQLELPDSLKRANARPFSLVLLYADTPLPNTPTVSNNALEAKKKVFIFTREGLEKYGATIVGKPLRMAKGAKHHKEDSRHARPIGVITNWRLEGDAFVVDGIGWDLEAEEEWQLIETNKDKMGASFELVSEEFPETAYVRFGEIPFAFTGAAVLWQDAAAAGDWTYFLAAQKEENFIVLTTTVNAGHYHTLALTSLSNRKYKGETDESAGHKHKFEIEIKDGLIRGVTDEIDGHAHAIVSWISVEGVFAGPNDPKLPEDILKSGVRVRTIFYKTFNAAYENYKPENDENYDEDKTLEENRERYAFAVAYAQLKKMGFDKKDDRWVHKERAKLEGTIMLHASMPAVASLDEDTISNLLKVARKLLNRIEENPEDWAAIWALGRLVDFIWSEHGALMKDQESYQQYLRDLASQVLEGSASDGEEEGEPLSDGEGDEQLSPKELAEELVFVLEGAKDMPPEEGGTLDLAEMKEKEGKFDREEAKRRQKIRAKREGITPKPTGSLIMPKKWRGIVPDHPDYWLDWTNYSFPVHDPPHVRNAAARLAQEKVRKYYSKRELKILEEKLDKVKKKFKIGEYREAEGNIVQAVKDAVYAAVSAAISSVASIFSANKTGALQEESIMQENEKSVAVEVQESVDGQASVEELRATLEELKTRVGELEGYYAEVQHELGQDWQQTVRQFKEAIAKLGVATEGKPFVEVMAAVSELVGSAEARLKEVVAEAELSETAQEKYKDLLSELSVRLPKELLLRVALALKESTTPIVTAVSAETPTKDDEDIQRYVDGILKHIHRIKR